MGLRSAGPNGPSSAGPGPGAIDTKNLSFPERAMLMAFRGLEGDFRDWAKINAWVLGIADALGSET
jgi:hypothetical protein